MSVVRNKLVAIILGPEGMGLISLFNSCLLYTSTAIYAGAQKNLSMAGVTVIVVKDEMLGKAPREIPTMLDYRTHVETVSYTHLDVYKRQTASRSWLSRSIHIMVPLVIM